MSTKEDQRVGAEGEEVVEMVVAEPVAVGYKSPDVEAMVPEMERVTVSSDVAGVTREVEQVESPVEIMAAFRIDPFGVVNLAKNDLLPEISKMEASAVSKKIDVWIQELFAELLGNYIEDNISYDHPYFTIPRAQKIGKGGEFFNGLEAGSPEFMALHAISANFLDCKAALVQRYLDTSGARESMHDVSRLEYFYFREVLSAVNAFSDVWLKDNGSLLNTKDRQLLGFYNEVAAIRKDESGDYVEVPWCEAYPAEIHRIVVAYRTLAGALQADLSTETWPEGEKFLDDEAREIFAAKINYYRAVADAYEKSTYEAFLEADTLQPGQAGFYPNMPLHVATIERGYGTDEVQRIPEASMRFPDSDGARVNKLADDTKWVMERELEALFREGNYTEAMIDTLRMVSNTTFMASDFFGGGMEMYFMPAGQILPNEVEARMKGGVSVTVNRQTMLQRMERLHDAFEALFPAEVVDLLFARGKVDLDEMLGKGVASHEFGHAIGLVPDTFDRISKPIIGTYSEEWKATVGGMILSEWRPYCEPAEGEEPVTIDTLRKTLVGHIAGAGRYASQRRQSYAIPYLRQDLMLLNVMEDEGVLFEYDGKWEIDLSQERVEAVYRRLEIQYIIMLEIYEKGGHEDMANFMAKRLQPTAFGRYLFKQIDERFPADTAGANSIDEICKFPTEKAEERDTDWVGEVPPDLDFVTAVMFISSGEDLPKYRRFLNPEVSFSQFEGRMIAAINREGSREIEYAKGTGREQFVADDYTDLMTYALSNMRKLYEACKLKKEEK